ncbi:MAG: hypothetical protein ACLT3Y_07040 [Ruminococcus callidus]
MQQRQKKKQAMRRFAASLTAAVLAAASLPVSQYHRNRTTPGRDTCYRTAPAAI